MAVRRHIYICLFPGWSIVKDFNVYIYIFIGHNVVWNSRDFGTKITLYVLIWKILSL